MIPALPASVVSHPLVASSGAGDLGDGFLLAVVGITVVFAALSVVGAMMTLGARLLSGQRSSHNTPGQQPRPRAMATPDAASIDDRRLVAILTAAAVAALGPRVRITRIQRVRRNADSIWVGHGRMVVQSSHRLQRTKKP